MATNILSTSECFRTILATHMHCNWAHQGHKEIHTDNQGSSEIWMSIHFLKEIHKINDEIPGTRHDNMFKHIPIQKWDIERPHPNGHHPRLLKS